MSMIFLIGMPGAGKTYWGQKIAKTYQLDFIDLDTFIEEKENKKIGKLFEEIGEDSFRNKEHDALNEICRGYCLFEK